MFFSLPLPARKIFRRLESLHKKLISAQLAVACNKICLKDNILPRYSNIRLHSDAARSRRSTLDFRRTLVEEELQEKTRLVESLRQEVDTHTQSWTNTDVPEETKRLLNGALHQTTGLYTEASIRKTTRKLANLNGGPMRIPHPTVGYVNLTNYRPTPDEEELLQFGINCHTMEKPRPLAKRLEIEVLLDQIHRLVDDGKVSASPELQPQLIAESSRSRGSFCSRLLEPRHHQAAKNLRNNPDFTVRRADKAAMFVLIPTEQYLSKLDSTLSDTTKFQRITRDPTLSTIRKANKIIDVVNTQRDGLHLQKITGDFRPGYLYGNVKTHKEDNPLRPIISQIPTPTYNLAKTLNDILSPLVPTDNCFKSSREFLDCVNSTPAEGVMASLDMESLFTNVPVLRTIDYICDHVYRSSPHPLLNIAEIHLRELLRICTQESAFRCPRGNLYQQIDGVAMGSPLGVLFANFFMGSVEKEVFSRIARPLSYGRYVDDIFVRTTDPENRDHLRRLLQEVSGLRFTTEEAVDGVLPYLDVLLTQNAGGTIHTTVYTKPTNPGSCLNGDSECPQRYKDSTIASFYRRALTHCSNWTSTQSEIDRSTQLLINNGHSNNDCQRVLRAVMNKWYEGQQAPEGEGNTFTLFYRAYMSSAYKDDERALQRIIRNNVTPAMETDRIKLSIYYKNKRTKDLILKNNSSPRPTDLECVSLVYQFQCPFGDCTPQDSYIGLTTTRLSRRLTYHLNSGGPKRHLHETHGTIITRSILENNTKIIDRESDKRRLALLEALHIKNTQPTLNTQQEAPTILPSLKPFRNRQTRRPNFETDPQDQNNREPRPQRTIGPRRTFPTRRTP